MPPSLTIINEKGIKGLLLLGLTKREREDVIDMIELSSPQSQRESEQRVREKTEHLSMKEVHAMLGKTKNLDANNEHRLPPSCCKRPDFITAYARFCNSQCA